MVWQKSSFLCLFLSTCRLTLTLVLLHVFLEQYWQNQKLTKKRHFEYKLKTATFNKFSEVNGAGFFLSQFVFSSLIRTISALLVVNKAFTVLKLVSSSLIKSAPPIVSINDSESLTRVRSRSFSSSVSSALKTYWFWIKELKTVEKKCTPTIPVLSICFEHSSKQLSWQVFQVACVQTNFDYKFSSLQHAVIRQYFVRYVVTEIWPV